MDMWSLGISPINADQPTGADARYEPEFDKLQAEIDKLSSPTASSGGYYRDRNTVALCHLGDASCVGPSLVRKPLF